MVIGVYGLGRFGSFWARELSRHAEVRAWSRDETRPVPEGVVRASEDEVLAADAVVLCTAISSMEEVLGRIAPKLSPGALVMDTCSVKVHPARLMEQLLPRNVELLATHPMFGPDSGKDGLEGLPIMFHPLRASGETARFWTDFFTGMGLRIVGMTPEEHDREAAYTQGITHFIGRVLGQLDLKDSGIATAGYRDWMDIVRQTCNDPWQLFVDLQRFNPYTARMRGDLHRVLDLMLDRFDSIDSSAESSAGLRRESD